jgi:hypothetical protein
MKFLYDPRIFLFQRLAVDKKQQLYNMKPPMTIEATSTGHRASGTASRIDTVRQFGATLGRRFLTIPMRLTILVISTGGVDCAVRRMCDCPAISSRIKPNCKAAIGCAGVTERGAIV